MSRKKLSFADKILKTMGTLSQREFARRLGISPSTLWEYLHGRTPPADFIARICEQFDIDESWLLTGEGEMKKPLAKYENTEHNIDYVAEPGQGYYTGVTEKIFLMLEKMTEEQRRDVLKYIEEKQLLKELLEERMSKKVR